MGDNYTTSDKKVIDLGDVLQKFDNSMPEGNVLVVRHKSFGNRDIIGPLSENLANSYELAVNAVIDSRTLVLVDATGMVAGTVFKMEELIDGVPSTFYGVVISVATNTLTIDRPIDRMFTSAAIINRENFDMASTDGSGTPVVFAYINNFPQKVNVTRIMLNMITSNNTPYNGFGDIAAPGLTRGIEVRKKNKDGTFTNYYNAKTNNRLDLLMFDFKFFDPTHPQAVNGISGRFTFEKLGSPVVLEEGEELQIVVQDNLTSLLSFEAVAEGNRED